MNIKRYRQRKNKTREEIIVTAHATVPVKARMEITTHVTVPMEKLISLKGASHGTRVAEMTLQVAVVLAMTTTTSVTMDHIGMVIVTDVADETTTTDRTQ